MSAKARAAFVRGAKPLQPRAAVMCSAALPRTAAAERVVGRVTLRAYRDCIGLHTVPTLSPLELEPVLKSKRLPFGRLTEIQKRRDESARFRSDLWLSAMKKHVETQITHHWGIRMYQVGSSEYLRLGYHRTKSATLNLSFEFHERSMFTSQVLHTT